jgi:hypothetical protein
MHSGSYSDSRVARQRFLGELVACCGQGNLRAPLHKYFEFFLGTGNGGHRVGCVHCFHTNIQLHYISVLLILFKRVEILCGIGPLLFFFILVGSS